MTVFEFQAEEARMAGKRLAYWVETTQPDRLDWIPKPEPESEARDVLDQIGECVRVNRMFAAFLRGETPAKSEWKPATSAEAQTALIESANEYAAAIAAQDDSVFEKEFSLPWGPAKGQFMITMPLLNMNYHGGAINYIQCLYGDGVFHYAG